MTTLPIPIFGRRFFASGEPFARIGSGSLGGKAQGLVNIHQALTAAPGPVPDLELAIPVSVVLTTDAFEAFLERNRIGPARLEGLSDDRIAQLFQKADLPTEFLGDLRALAEEVQVPLALRSSSRLEDALYRPFAGVYATKMIPNNQPDRDVRFRKLVEGIKFVYATTFFEAARSYLKATPQASQDEQMAVLIQEVVGSRYGDRFYPVVSGVARSYNYYPLPPARPEEGVVSLALGLGKTIVDGGVCWTYSPAHPAAPPPYGSTKDLLNGTQLRFWAVHMGRPPEYNPLAETEHLAQSNLQDAEYDGTLGLVASTYQPQADRIVPGTAVKGPRVLTFAPLLCLGEFPLNEIVLQLLAVCQEAVGAAVEIEFALDFPRGSRRARLGFLQVRPMAVPHEQVEVSSEAMASEGVVVASSSVLGNGLSGPLYDVVYARPHRFEARLTPALAVEIASRNAELVEQGRPYLLIGFGRWGCSDPWLGIPVKWGHICGARAIVEATLPSMNIEPSQGSHFFHNLSSFGVSYFSVSHRDGSRIDWDWLAAQEAVVETELLRHVRLAHPLEARVDGRTGRGVVGPGAA